MPKSLVLLSWEIGLDIRGKSICLGLETSDYDFCPSHFPMTGSQTSVRQEYSCKPYVQFLEPKETLDPRLPRKRAGQDRKDSSQAPNGSI